MRHSPRKAFTLIELLVVIGIILVLIAIVVVGLRHVNATAATHETAAELKICTDVLRNYQSINGFANVEGPAVVPINSLPMPAPWMYPPNPPLTLPLSLPIFVDAPTEVTGNQPESTITLADLTVGGYPGTLGDMGDKAGINNPRWNSTATRCTQAVMFILFKDPKNRALISNVPPKRILETPPPQNPGDPPPAPFTIDAAVPLDGWGNPIIYVPRGGLHVVMNPTNGSQAKEYVVRTSGTYLLNANLPPVGPNDRPFFASAGQDGYFSDPAPLANAADYAIDNLYSFQEK